MSCPIGSLNIPDGVTSIGNYEFLDCTDITSVTIPSSVVSIGDYAFWNCTGITSITISEGVVSIGGYAFGGCTNITSVTIPSSVLSIGSYAFSDCTNLTSINVNSNNPNYFSNQGVLYNKSRKNLICCPAEKTGSFTIPTTVTQIINFAFSDCTNITNITIPSSVASIGDYSFSNCDSLTSIVVNSSNSNYSSYDGVLYNKSRANLICCPAGKAGAFTIPKTVTSISNYVFFNCDNLSSVNIPSNVKSICNLAFLKCTGLTSINVDANNSNYSSYEGVLYNKSRTNLIYYPAGKSGSFTIPSSVVSIGDSVFLDCISLTSVIIPSSVKNIDNSAFMNCKDLVKVYFFGDKPTVGINVFYKSLVKIYYIYGNNSFPNPWVLDSGSYETIPCYSVTYNDNGSTSGTVPVDGNIYPQEETVTILGNTGYLEKANYNFMGWNTSADGTGKNYMAKEVFQMKDGNVILYANWSGQLILSNTLITITLN